MTHNINSAPKFAVVGHPNKGKSSIVATLSQNDAIAIALEPGTTRAQQSYPLRVDDKILYTLVDTPGFQRPRRVLEWLEAHSVSRQIAAKLFVHLWCSIKATRVLLMSANCLRL